MNVPKELIDDAARLGIVEGAVVKCVADNKPYKVGPVEDWVMYPCDPHAQIFSGSAMLRGSRGDWATVITPAPSQGLQEGDACECGPAMRAAIIELANERGLLEEDYEESATLNKHVQFTNGNVRGLTENRYSYHDRLNFLPSGQFYDRLSNTASQPKPEPPIMIGSDKVEFRKGSIKVGCTTIDNATVKAIAAKLQD